MKKYFPLLLLVVSIVFMGCVSKTSEVEPVAESADQVVVDTKMMEAEEIEYEYAATLKDVAGGNSSGEVMAGFIENEYRMIASFENLPELEEGYFYEGWVVRKSPMSVISTGATQLNSNGDHINLFSDEKDLTDHLLYVLTLEPDDDDPAPAAHVLEGNFRAL